MYLSKMLTMKVSNRFNNTMEIKRLIGIKNYLRSDLFGPLLGKLSNVYAAVGAISQERPQIKPARSFKIALAQLNHGAILGDASPRFVQKLSRERIQNNIDAFAGRLAHDTREKRDVSRVEDAVTWNADVYQMLDFLFAAHCGKDLCLHHLADLNGRQTDAATC
jgi:hypothetical protein